MGNPWTDILYLAYTYAPMLHIRGYFSGGKIFVVFVVERRTTKFIPTKEYRIVPECGLVYRDHERTGQKFTAHENFTPRKISATRYVVSTV